ncbi:MAG: diguanylate cyclase domain-containing protein, partial [Gammaproteobacteria bacterium]
MDNDETTRGRNKRLIMLAIGIALVTGVAICFSLIATELVTDRANKLVITDIPRLRAVGTLQNATHQRALHLYAYYATTDPQEWQSSERIREKFSEYIASLAGAKVPQAEIHALQGIIDQSDTTAARFHVEMIKGRARDWDSLREHLATFQRISGELNRTLSRRAENVRASASEGGRQTLSEIARLNRTQIAFVVAVSLVAFFVIMILRARLKDEEELYRRAYFDPLTGLPNHRHLEKDWPTLATGDVLPALRALLIVSLDRYHLLTGTFGHNFSNQVVLEVQLRLQRVLAGHSPACSLYSLAPATWLVVNADQVDHADSIVLEEAILDSTQEPLFIEEREILAACSVGVAYGPEHGDALEQLLRNADSGLREAQSSGGHRCKIYDPEVMSRSKNFLSTEGAIRRGLKAGEFELFLQPKLRAQDRRCAGAEALLRWR